MTTVILLLAFYLVIGWAFCCLLLALFAWPLTSVLFIVWVAADKIRIE